MIDLRSDTVTRPCAGMRQAMVEAQVGDDVMGDDPTVHALQERIASLLGKEAGLFMPSGSMANLVAVRVHCAPGDELLCEENCHIYNYEQGAYAQFCGVATRCLAGVHGQVPAEQFFDKIRPDDMHAVRTRMVALENTHNRGGGTVQALENTSQICDWARQYGLATHLDGARLFNAVTASGVAASQWARGFDSVSVCFSKGLGAPIGSALVGSHEFIRQARRVRKAFGGGMRQVGMLAAAALYALEHNRERMQLDHQHARQLAEAAEAAGFQLDPPPQTNIVILRVPDGLGDAAWVVNQLLEGGVGALPFGPQHVRLVTHLDVDAGAIDQACQVLRGLRQQAAAGSFRGSAQRAS